MTIIDFISQKILDRDLEFLALFGNKKGEDSPYHEWLKSQPCKACGRRPRYEMSTFIYNMPAHVRRVSFGSGVSIKPPWNITTLCNDCHQVEHGKGRTSVAPVETLQAWADESLCLFVVTSLRDKLGEYWKLLLPWWVEEQGIEINFDLAA